MGRDWTERQRLAAAKTPSAWTTHPAVVTREDLFNEIDLLKARLAEKDGMLDSVIVARLTRIRSLAATLCPKPPAHVCDFEYPCGVVCGVAYRSESRLREHQWLIHDVRVAQTGERYLAKVEVRGSMPGTHLSTETQ